MQDAIEQNMEKPYEKRSGIQFTFINFIPMINKIKIDLLMNRKPSILYNTDYLAGIDQSAEDFDNIDDLFLADLFSKHEENLDFFTQKSVQKIIDRQF